MAEDIRSIVDEFYYKVVNKGDSSAMQAIYPKILLTTTQIPISLKGFKDSRQYVYLLDKLQQ